MTQTEAKWAERVREWRASGGTAEKFAEGHGFKASTLRFWASHLRTKAREVTALAMPESEVARVQLVRVRRTRGCPPTPTEGSASATMVIAIGPARIEVRSGFDRALLSEVIEALG